VDESKDGEKIAERTDESADGEGSPKPTASVQPPQGLAEPGTRDLKQFGAQTPPPINELIALLSDETPEPMERRVDGT
jgi:hypothetical protein